MGILKIYRAKNKTACKNDKNIIKTTTDITCITFYEG